MTRLRPAAQDIAEGVEIARAALRDGANMMHALAEGTGLPRAACIEIAYALQSGAYTAARTTSAAPPYRAEIHAALHALFTTHHCRSVLDLGAGEGTAWYGWTGALDHLCLLDLSLNRLRWAPCNLAGAPVRELSLVKGEIARPPASALDFDAVTTMHALEPNGPSAGALVEAAASCAARLLVLFEPDYSSASSAMRARMERHGYAQDIFVAAEALEGFEIVDRKRLESPVNPDNATSLIALARIHPPGDPAPGRLADPLTRRPLIAVPGGFEAQDGAMAYPSLYGVSCLSPDDGVLLGRF